MALRNKYFTQFSKHFSFFVLGTASISFFLVNIILKDTLTPEKYGVYSIFITYISLLSSFGLLGFEQVLIRTTQIIKGKLLVEKEIILPIIISLIIVSFLASFIFLNNYPVSINYLYFIFLTMCVIVVKVLYNLFRMLSQFIFAQIALNLWKIGLFLALVYCIIYGLTLDLIDIVWCISLVFFITTFFIISFRSNLGFVNLRSSRKLFKQATLFFLSLLTISLINFGDRFFIESRFGLEELGMYFFYINLFLFPFTLFQTYVGFKEIVSFKLKYSHNILLLKLKKIVLYGFLFACILFALAYVIDSLGLYSLEILLNIKVILLLMLLGIIKMAYSLLSSAMGAICNNQMLYKINRDSIISIILLSPFIYYFSFELSITLLFLICLWSIRCVIWYRQLVRFEN